jgi:hypothetical protein
LVPSQSTISQSMATIGVAPLCVPAAGLSTPLAFMRLSTGQINEPANNWFCLTLFEGK